MGQRTQRDKLGGITIFQAREDGGLEQWGRVADSGHIFRAKETRLAKAFG